MPKNKFTCVECGQQFGRYKDKAKYCSKECQFNHMTGKNHPQYKNGDSAGTKTKCDYCGEEFERNRNKQEYCCVSHANKHQYETGERDKTGIKKTHEARRKEGLEKFKENPTTKISKRGYRVIYIPAAYANEHKELERGWMKMHHYIWWKEKGELPPVDNINEKGNRYVMHHKDGDKLNNDIDNLEIMKNKEHRKLHAND